MTRTELLPEIFKLSERDQAMIAQAIRERLHAAPAQMDVEEFNRELDRRVADADANPQSLIPLDVAIARIKGRL